MPDKETEIEATVLKHVDKGYVSEDRVLGQRPELKKRTSHKSIWGKRGDLKLGGGDSGAVGAQDQEMLCSCQGARTQAASTHTKQVILSHLSHTITPTRNNNAA